MEDNFFDKNPDKTVFFYFVIIILFVLSLLSIGVDLTEFSQKRDINIPQWFFHIIFTVDFILIASIIAIFFYRKIGVIVYPIAIIIHFFLHEFYLTTMLYSDLFNLFVFVGIGLLSIIPKWNFFK